MKVLSSSEIRSADKATIDSGLIGAAQLMERAACACLPAVFAALSGSGKLLVYCGNGNNGGDGLVIARHVALTGIPVMVVTALEQEKKSALFLLNKDKLRGIPGVRFISSEEAESEIPDHDNLVIVDAIFGSGLREAPGGIFKDWILQINASSAYVISIDVPSGVPGEKDDFPSWGHVAVKASETLTFQFPRISFFMPQWRMFTGKISVLPIGLLDPPSWSDKYFFVNHEFASSLLMERNPYGHKGSFGHLLLAAGSSKYAGAAIMSCCSALRSGVGLVTAFIPACMKAALNANCPEAMLFESDAPYELAGPPKTESFSALAIGPGMGTSQPCADLLKYLIGSFGGSKVLDADALNILSENPTWLAFLSNAVLTPHPGEFERLAGKSADGPERWNLLSSFALRHQVVVVLKGFNTMIAMPDGTLFFNGSGNAGMAKGGSGDVLAGLIGGLLAQGYSPGRAAVLGVFLHGLAGDLAAQNIGPNAMTPADIISQLGNAFRRISVHLNKQ